MSAIEDPFPEVEFLNNPPEGAAKVNNGSTSPRIRALSSVEEMNELVALQKEIWGYGEEGADHPYPARALFALSESGGLVSGAFVDGELAGFSVAWIGYEGEDGPPYLHSQLVGVRPRFRGQGIGFHLKCHQRKFALRRGLELMRWTFDPLQARNARLNIYYLGGVVESYRDHYYGEVQSLLTRGLDTDRVWVDWHLSSHRVEKFLSGHRLIWSWTELPSATSTSVRTDSRQRKLVDHELGHEEPELVVEIPTGFDEIREESPAEAHQWRLRSREIFKHYLLRGYVIDDFQLDREAERAFYRLSRRGLPVILAGD